MHSYEVRRIGGTEVTVVCARHAAHAAERWTQQQDPDELEGDVAYGIDVEVRREDSTQLWRRYVVHRVSEPRWEASECACTEPTGHIGDGPGGGCSEAYGQPPSGERVVELVDAALGSDELTIATERGPSLVLGTAVGEVFAVHREHLAGAVVTHRPSGYAVARARSNTAALDLAHQLDAVLSEYPVWRTAKLVSGAPSIVGVGLVAMRGVISAWHAHWERVAPGDAQPNWMRFAACEAAP